MPQNIYHVSYTHLDGKIFFMSTRPLVIGELVRVRVNDTLDYDLLGEFEE